MTGGDSLRTLRDKLKVDAKTTLKTELQIIQAFLSELSGKCRDKLHKVRKEFRGIREEGITAALINPIEDDPFTIRPDSQDNGHVDLLLFDWKGKLILKGEAKITTKKNRYFAYYRKGLNKLLKKYCHGTERRALLISYCRLPRWKSQLEKFVEKLSQGDPDVYLEEFDESRREYYCLHPDGTIVSRHNYDGPAEIIHIWVNMDDRTDKEIEVAKDENYGFLGPKGLDF